MQENAQTKVRISLLAHEYWQGIKDIAPLMVGVVPFGITCGIMAVAVGLTPLEAVLMSLIVFAGAAQFVSIMMLGDGSVGLGLIGVTTLLINLRHLLMGASLAPYMLKLPLRLQAFLAFGMADETYAVTINKTQRDGYNANYQFGTNSAGYVTWAVSTIVGAVLGRYIDNPLSWGLDFAMPATFLALLIPRIAERTGFIVFLSSAIVSVLACLYLPGKWYIIAACIVGTITGGLLEGGEEHEN
jgi:4-azaleucine resistance transporter AzlC